VPHVACGVWHVACGICVHCLYIYCCLCLASSCVHCCVMVRYDFICIFRVACEESVRVSCGSGCSQTLSCPPYLTLFDDEQTASKERRERG